VAADGAYSLHYFAQDCAGTEELKFTPVGNGGWATSFYSVPVSVDTVPPRVASGPIFSVAPDTIKGTPNAFSLNQKVNVSYSCTDNASGIAICGTKTYAAPGTTNTGLVTATLDTSSVGRKTLTIPVADIAGNAGVPVTVTYNVVSATADVAIYASGANTVSTGDRLSYHLLVLNSGPNVAQDVVIKDILPAGTTFVSAGFEDVVCYLFSGCGSAPQSSSCSVKAGTVTCDAGDLKPLSLFSLKWIAVNVVVKVTAPAKTTLVNRVAVQSDSPDPNPSNNSDTVQTTVRR
jgi:uncharacterized repeat protein (TIGR01451 family)